MYTKRPFERKTGRYEGVNFPSAIHGALHDSG